LRRFLIPRKAPPRLSGPARSKGGLPLHSHRNSSASDRIDVRQGGMSRCLGSYSGVVRPRALKGHGVHRQWRLKDAMQWIVILAIYLAAFHSLNRGPSDNLLTTWGQIVAAILVLFVLPLQMLLVWARSR
jgi:hypothetical protein